jgi:cytidylate kinase
MKVGFVIMPKSYRTCEIMQQADYISFEQIEAGLDHNAIKDYAYILHDKDTDADGNLKAPHYHIMLRFKDSVPTTSICSWFGVKENYINKIHGSFGDALAYLTHKNAPSKYQYLDENVVTNFEFKKEVEKALSRKKCDERKEEIINLIVAGEIRQYNYNDYITPVEYDRYSKAINNAFSYRRDLLVKLDRDMVVVYIYGDSGVGKTSYGRMLAVQKGYSTYITGSSNDPFEDYKGQDCIIFDDIRSIGMDISDVLKILDNHVSSSVRSRYHNKVIECKLLILTCPDTLEVFYQGLLTDRGDTIKQLRRRIKYYIKMEKDTLRIDCWNAGKERYVYGGNFKNPIADIYKKVDLTPEELSDDINNFFGLEKSLPDTAGFKKVNDEEYKQLGFM